MTPAASLPDFDDASLQRSERVVERVRAAIEASPDGVIGFDRFMDIALYAPALGYYCADHPIFGAAGDFVTAPESGTLFARCLARACAAVMESAGPDLVEYGPGSARLVAALEAVLGDRVGAIHLVEPSATLRERQRAALAQAGAAAKARWQTAHPPPGVRGVVVANEVVDAMPAKRYRVARGALHELGVAVEGDGLAWRELPGAAPPPALAASLAGYPDGFTTEAIPGLAPWLAALRAALVRGVVLLIDYGYVRHEYLHPARADGTLKCHLRHRVHADPFHAPGLEDLTTAVNFSDLADAAGQAGFDVAGFTTLNRFLIDCGIEHELAASATAEVGHDHPLAAEARRLLLPGEMGQTCKVMALAVDYDGGLPGFAADERHRLDRAVAGGGR